MHRKLSQSPHCPTGIATQALATTLFLTLMSAGCDSLNAAPGPPAASEAALSEAEAPFEWPIDATHPVLRITIDAPAVQGAIDVELMPELAPTSAARFLAWAETGYYDGTTFHRVIPEFMLQGGDPNSRDRDPSNDGLGGMDEPLIDEFSAAPLVRGTVAMANRGVPQSSGSQFFIMHGDKRALDGAYIVIGRVRSGMDIVDAISGTETDRFERWGSRDRPLENVTMTSVRQVTVESDEFAKRPD